MLSEDTEWTKWRNKCLGGGNIFKASQEEIETMKAQTRWMGETVSSGGMKHDAEVAAVLISSLWQKVGGGLFTKQVISVI